MILILRNLFFVILSILVVCLSMGISISKMHCSKDGKLFIGSEVPNCMQEQELACIMDMESISCCNTKDMKKSCCPQTKDNSCASETANIQFDFETLVSILKFEFKELSVLLYTFIVYDKECNICHKIYFFNGVPWAKINNPELAEIQSFLL